MGTPDLGSALARWAKAPVLSLGVLTSSSTCLLSVLQTDNDVLPRIQNEFLEMIRARSKMDRGIEITCFYEALPMAMVGTIVPQNRLSSPALTLFQSAETTETWLDPTARSILDCAAFLERFQRWIDAVRYTSSVSAPRAQLADIGHVIGEPSESLVPIDKSKVLINYQNRSSQMADSEILDIDSRLVSTTLPLPPVKPNVGATALFRRTSVLTPLHRTGGISQPWSTFRDGYLGEISDPGSSGRSIGPVKIHDPIEGAKEPRELNLLFKPNEVRLDLIFVQGLSGGSQNMEYPDPSTDCWPPTFLPFE
jgi:hypothetical protein